MYYTINNDLRYN